MAVQCLESRFCARIKSTTHYFEFDYLKLKNIPVDQCISSPPFSVGGYDWALDFYPHGDDSDQENDGSHDFYPHGGDSDQENDGSHDFYPHGGDSDQENDGSHDFYPHGGDSDQENDRSHDFYPHGGDSDQKYDGSHASLYLRLLSKTKDVYAESSFDILDNKGKLVPFDEPTSDTFTSPGNGNCCRWGYPEFISRDEIEACYCKDGKLVISCNIRILSAPSGVDDSSGGLCEDIKKLWEKGEKFDVTFEVEGERISAHRLMLAARSPVFEAELYGPFAESNSICIVNIHDMKAEVFKALICFIYTDDFEPPSVELVQDLFVASDRYDLQMLKAKCQQRLWVDLSIENVLPTLILAEQHSSPWLKEKCLEFASKSDNFTQLALTEGYVHMMQSFPSLLLEFRNKVNISSDVVNNAKEAEDQLAFAGRCTKPLSKRPKAENILCWIVVGTLIFFLISFTVIFMFCLVHQM